MKKVFRDMALLDVLYCTPLLYMLEHGALHSRLAQRLGGTYATFAHEGKQRVLLDAGLITMELKRLPRGKSLGKHGKVYSLTPKGFAIASFIKSSGLATLRFLPYNVYSRRVELGAVHSS